MNFTKKTYNSFTINPIHHSAEPVSSNNINSGSSKMQGASLLCPSSTPIPLSLTLSSHAPSIAPTSSTRTMSSFAACSPYPFPLNLLRFRSHGPLLPHCSTSATVEESLEASGGESEFVEVGYVCKAHGLQGEIRVKPNTDFPELRFSKPGRRWLRQQVSGRQTVREVELVQGRDHPGQKSWIVRFKGIDSVDLANQLVGSTILVKEDDRPELQDGEFYSRDLIGMSVYLKETDELVGVVDNVFDTGANDLLHVLLHSSKAKLDADGKLKLPTGISAPHAWIPFVEAVVPIVDMVRREMRITPPEGLLDLNLRSDERSKKERRQLEWKERKKFQQHLVAAKKKLCEIEQQHVLHGFGFGNKTQKRLLAAEIVDINSELLQLFLQNIGMPPKRWNLSEFVKANSAKLIKNTLKMSEELSVPCGSDKHLDSRFIPFPNGLDVTSKGKTAVFLVVSDTTELSDVEDVDLARVSPYPDPDLLKLLQDPNFVKFENRISVPIILVSGAEETQNLQNLFADNGYFGFDPEKIWFLEELKLPVVGNSIEAKNKHKILMKSPWEIVQSPIGSGGVISLLSSNKRLEELGEMGVEFIEVCSAKQRYAGGHLLLRGLMSLHEADVGIQTFQDLNVSEDSFAMVFSMRYMKKLVKQISKLESHALLKPNSYVEMVGREWVDIVPSISNSYEFHCSIYSSLIACPAEKICALEILE